MKKRQVFSYLCVWVPFLPYFRQAILFFLAFLSILNWLALPFLKPVGRSVCLSFHYFFSGARLFSHLSAHFKKLSFILSSQTSSLFHLCLSFLALIALTSFLFFLFLFLLYFTILDRSEIIILDNVLQSKECSREREWEWEWKKSFSILSET